MSYVLRPSRRRFLRGASAASFGAALIAGGGYGSFAHAPFKADPFSLGIASGDPASDGFVIWTRLAPESFDGGGLEGHGAVEVAYEVSDDATFKRLIRAGRVLAQPASAHTVHVEITGLEPGRDYVYRFVAAGVRSAVGRARTLPAPGAAVSQLRFATVGCQRWEHGHFTAYRHLAAEQLDLAFHYGDYIYEYAQLIGQPTEHPVVRRMPRDYGVCRTLADYRNRYAVYKSDPDLQAAHASTPFISSFDDHEVANNWADQFAAGRIEPTPSDAFLKRRAAAFQAWYEHMPVRRAQAPSGAHVLMHRRFTVGDLATLHVLDTRQYRTAPPCGDGWRTCLDARHPKRSLLGEAQESWLFAGLADSRTRWNVLAQQVMMMQLTRKSEDGNGLELHTDRWDGAPAGRDRLFDVIEQRRLPGMVTLTGDIHSNWAGDLKRDFASERSATLGVEFVATSIASGGDGSDGRSRLAAVRSANPHIKFFNNQRGYVRHTVRRDHWQADFRVLASVRQPDALVATRQSLTTLRDRPGVQPS